ncbi:PhoH family protein [Phaeobacter gallaeciensis]|uniref:PhoH family protein n=1 Tax=Phaeobacter gallaeciensis TaxID=60890 RepID=UPI00238089ED|nr:PhoH family protein [Phaeobacter gallaeciensis]MDE4297072.1 PhoH family protein [Phaeobacter gallaeciensis]
MPKKRKSNSHNTRQERREQRRNNKRGQEQFPAAHDNENRPPRQRVKPMQEPVVPLTEAQADYDDAFRSHKMIFGIGPAGTGKTWFAAMRAAEALANNEIDRIIVTRPIVEAEEEKFGTLPGDLMEKYEPFLRPVKDALEEYFGTGHLEYLLRQGIIEPRPLSFLRGSTLKNCWVIADEMQNATIGQHKLLLTRFGENAKFIINGDPSQADIPEHKSGLMPALNKLKHIETITAIHFEREDIVREGLVQEIVEAFEA